MAVIVLKLVACALFGALLAQHWLPVGAGLAGAAAIILAARWQRARWHGDSAAPEAAERSALLSIAGTLVCLGYFLAMLYQIAPDMDVHARVTRGMATELWILIAASLVAQWIARAPAATQDELDASIAAGALSASCYFLLALQAILIVMFGLLVNAGDALRSVDLLAHLFIGSWMLAHVFHGLYRVQAYASLRAAQGKIS